jgi:hypothetical protein
MDLLSTHLKNYISIFTLNFEIKQFLNLDPLFVGDILWLSAKQMLVDHLLLVDQVSRLHDQAHQVGDVVRPLVQHLKTVVSK